MPNPPSPVRVTAVLGPTNTGKTHFAMERLLAHAGGMIGFPLRLLARENYDRAVRLKGAQDVALITGEEKIVPPRARYLLCTVEAMPLDRRVPFLAVDEIQMAADPERGHVFTDRLLHARGTEETLLLGADTTRPMIRALVPEAEFVGRARLSTLRHAGMRKVTRLPPRSAVVAFSTAEVYGLAELVRRQRGGAAVVLGALSPRTRNAQVALYQAGEVDYLVATDAIGMGLNMDVDHIAFANLAKFDGRSHRSLSAAELAQIAGRAGRHMNDGSFGTTAEAGPLDPAVVERIENHRFEPLKALQWRSSCLEFSSLAALRRSLAAPPPAPGLMRAREADDERALALLANDAEVAAHAGSPDSVRLLWDVCGIPDFRKVSSEAHARLLKRIYGFLARAPGRLPADWLAAQLGRLDRTDGDIEPLVQRILGVRIWTFVSHNAAWVDDAAHWQEHARALEDRLSDALHEKLLHRFVDRRTSILTERNRRDRTLAPVVAEDGRVRASGFLLGHVEGLTFRAAQDHGGDALRRTVNAARVAARAAIASRAHELAADRDDAFALDDDGWLLWRGAAVARLAPGALPWRPALALLAESELPAHQRDAARDRLSSWLAATLDAELAPIAAALADDGGGPARGLLYQLAEGLGTIERMPVESLVRALSPSERRRLRALGVRIGRIIVFCPALLRERAIRRRALLWNARHGTSWAPPAAGRVSWAPETGVPDGFVLSCGFRPSGVLAVRVDMLERIASRAWALAKAGPFVVGPELMTLAGCGAEDMAAILKSLGYRSAAKGEPARFVRTRTRPSSGEPTARQTATRAHPSPFAKLGAMMSSSGNDG